MLDVINCFFFMLLFACLNCSTTSATLAFKMCEKEMVHLEEFIYLTTWLN